MIFLVFLLQNLQMGEGKLLWLLTLTIFFHSLSLHGNSEGRLASPPNSCFVDDDEECDATIRGFNGSIVGFPGSLFRPLPSRGVFNVEDYGAKGDGTDDSQVSEFYKISSRILDSKRPSLECRTCGRHLERLGEQLATPLPRLFCWCRRTTSTS